MYQLDVDKVIRSLALDTIRLDRFSHMQQAVNTFKMDERQRQMRVDGANDMELVQRRDRLEKDKEEYVLSSLSVDDDDDDDDDIVASATILEQMMEENADVTKKDAQVLHHHHHKYHHQNE